jgi:hypothetical protein
MDGADVTDAEQRNTLRGIHARIPLRWVSVILHGSPRVSAQVRCE